MAAKSLISFPATLLLTALFATCSQPRTYNRGSDYGGPSRPADRAARYGMIDIRDVDPSIVVDLRYATHQNVAGRPLYNRDMPCLLHEGTARRLARAHAELRLQGYGIKIWDAYRPAQSHLALWNAAPNANYVVSPQDGWSRHCIGVAVDVTLVDSAGREMKMPTGFDDFSRSASATYIGSDPEIRRNLNRLQEAMRGAGFRTIASEWWHFEDTRATTNTMVMPKQLGIGLPPHVSQIPVPGSGTSSASPRRL